MKKTLGVIAVGTAVLLAGCASPNYLTERYNLPRADLRDQPVEVTHEPAPATSEPLVNAEPNNQNMPALPGTQDVVTGKWEFTTPNTVTRVERQNAELSEFSLYMGRPAPTDKPFVVITVSPPENDKANGGGDASQAEANPTEYHISGTRSYILNGNVAKEWTGLTKNGAAFCELILHRPGGGGDVCHAMAIARSEEQRTLALQILGSITWTPLTPQ